MILRPGIWVTRCSGRMLRFGTNGFFWLWRPRRPGTANVQIMLGCGGQDGRERLTFKSCWRLDCSAKGNMPPAAGPRIFRDRKKTDSKLLFDFLVWNLWFRLLFAGLRWRPFVLVSLGSLDIRHTWQTVDDARRGTIPNPHAIREEGTASSAEPTCSERSRGLTNLTPTVTLAQ